MDKRTNEIMGNGVQQGNFVLGPLFMDLQCFNSHY
jgi:hypothetical protein